MCLARSGFQSTDLCDGRRHNTIKLMDNTLKHMIRRKLSKTLDTLADVCRQAQLRGLPTRRRFARWFGPHLARYIEYRSAAPARATLKVKGRQTLLIDSSVNHHRQLTSFVGYWEDYEDAESGNYSAILRTQEVSNNKNVSDSRNPCFSITENLKYLPGIATLAREGRIGLYTSWELNSPYGIESKKRWNPDPVCDDIFRDVVMEVLDNSDPFCSELPAGPTLFQREMYCSNCEEYRYFDQVNPTTCPTCSGPTRLGSVQKRIDRRKKMISMEPLPNIPDNPDLKQRIQKFLDAAELNARLVELLEIFNPRKGHDWDYLHLATAEVNEIDAFLTLDRKFVNHIRNTMRTKRGGPSELRCDVLTPYEWANKWGVLPVEIPAVLGKIVGRRKYDPYWTPPDNPKTEEQVMKKLRGYWPP